MGPSIFRLNSLAARLIAAAAIWAMLALVVGGFVLSNAFRNAVQDNFDDTLSNGRIIISNG